MSWRGWNVKIKINKLMQIPKTQKPNYTKWPNPTLEAMAATTLMPSEYQIVMAVARKTYGFNKQTDHISVSQLMNMTGLSRRTIVYAMQNLEAKSIIFIQRQRGRGHKNQINSISLNENVSQWVVQRKAMQYSNMLKLKQKTYEKYRQKGSAVKGGGAEKGTFSSADCLHPQRKDTKKTFSPNSVEFGLSKFLFSLIQKNEPKVKEPDFHLWARHIDYMLRLDGRTQTEIETVIRWCQTDTSKDALFWRSNILSTAKLREKFSQLLLKMPQNAKPKQKIYVDDVPLYDDDGGAPLWALLGFNSVDEFGKFYELGTEGEDVPVKYKTTSREIADAIEQSFIDCKKNVLDRICNTLNALNDFSTERPRLMDQGHIWEEVKRELKANSLEWLVDEFNRKNISLDLSARLRQREKINLNDIS
jgi:phage replication O-like protein O